MHRAAPLPPPGGSKGTLSCSMPVLKGFLPMLFYSCFAGFVAIAYNYLTFDDMPMSSVLAASLAALSLVLSNDPSTWYNMIVFFYIGLEVRVLHFTLDFIETAVDGGNATKVAGMPNANNVQDRTLAWVAFVVVILHLVPFLLVNHRGLLAVLALAGAPINTALCGYLKLPNPASGTFDPDFTLLMLASSLGLLALTLFSIRMKCEECSLFTHFRRAVREGTWIYFAPYEM